MPFGGLKKLRQVFVRHDIFDLTGEWCSPILRAMPKFRNSDPRHWRSLALAGLLTLLSAAAVAAPDVPASVATVADPVTRFLSEKGLLNAPAGSPPADNAFVERMRDKASDMVLTAMNFLGVPYRRGGNTVDHGFDCSGFTRHVFEMSLGLVLPRRADEQAKTAGLMTIGRDALKPGDLVFFNTMRRTFSHVGIYVGEGKFIHAPKPGGEVRVEDMGAAYWTRRFTGARRADLGLDPAPADAAAAQPLAGSARNVY
jgi:cell wall-associated NlpC family hydrolase